MLEILTDDAHAGYEAFLKDVIDIETLLESLLCHLFDGVRLTYVEEMVHQCVISHFRSPSRWAGSFRA